ncbi:MAG: hypothetical protein ACRD0K_22585 [Egibacteraceae bacterium]
MKTIPLRDERAARSLRDELIGMEGVLDVRFAGTDAPPPPGARGPGISETVALLATVIPSVAAVATASVNAWAARSSWRKVRLSADGSVEIEGGIGRREQRLVRDWQHKGDNSSGSVDG